MIDLSEHDNTVFKGAIDVALLDHKSRLYQMWVLWKEYIDFHVVANDHIKKIMFFNLIGVILTHKQYGYSKADFKVMTRIHYFIFQRARSGKGEAMKAKHKLLVFLGIPTRYTQSDNPAAAVGTCQKNKTGKVDSRVGHLKTLYDYNWDEGSIIIKEGSNNSGDKVTLTDVLQGVMDEPGFVSKGMAWGDIQYETNSSICAGSYIFKEFAKTIMEKGFFQRMIISYKIFSEQEKQFMRRYVPLLKNRYNPRRIKRIMFKFKELVGEIPKLKDNMILFNKTDTINFVDRYDMVYDNIIKNQFTGSGSRTQEVLESFSDMSHLLVDKIAAQSAIIDGKKEVTYEDMLIALPVVKMHLSSIIELFNSVEMSSETPTMKREAVILNMIKRYPTIATHKMILSKLEVERRIGGWDVGRERVTDMLKSLIERKVLIVDDVNGVRILKINR